MHLLHVSGNSIVLLRVRAICLACGGTVIVALQGFFDAKESKQTR